MGSQTPDKISPMTRGEFRVRGSNVDLSLGRRTLVMGILNVTPDSFSDGGKFFGLKEAVRRAECLVEEGADLLDIGGESSRPGSDSISKDEEIRRVIPVIETIASRFSVPISIDTTKAEVARLAIAAGAKIINDISALSFDPAMVGLAANEGVPVVLMHMKGRPKDMQTQPHYSRLIQEVKDFLHERIRFAAAGGIPEERIILDPGIGFGKTAGHNLEILARLKEFLSMGRPILIGPSRKSFIGQILGLPAEERLEGTAAAVAVGILNGASIIRVHDVGSMVRVARTADAIRAAGGA